MPITRTPIINDDGSGTVGTVWENGWKTQLYDQIDALFAGPSFSPWKVIEVSGVTQPGADWNPGTGIVGNTIIYAQLVASITVYGFKPTAPAYPGQRIVVHTISDPSLVTSFYHEHPSPSAGCFIRSRKSPVASINGYWAWAEFQWGVLGGTGGWVLGGYGNGIGGALAE
jgi:hypothetical protein